MNMKKPESYLLLSFALSLIFLSALYFARAKAAVSVDIEKDVDTVILKDSDGDGLLDLDDPHPDVSEIYIVEDENRDGIVDAYQAEVDGENKKD